MASISHSFIGSVLETDGSGAQASGRSGRRAKARPSAAVYRVRRTVVALIAVLVVLAIVFAIHALAAPKAQPQANDAEQTAAQAARKRKAAKARAKARREAARAPYRIPRQPALTDQSRQDILAKAQKVADASGKPAHQYVYCVGTRGNVEDSSMRVFENDIFRTLNNPKGWPRAGATFTLGSADAGNCDFTMYLAQANQMTTFSADCSDEYSCRVGDDVIVNEDRWNGATKQLIKAGLTLQRYREMVINHEVGHRLGHIDNEQTCAGPGKPAPLMQEQSMALDGCKPNEWPTDSELWITE
ncbi:DUF3152 domain-containing protein [Bifidobacterium sp. ESL0763]|uniref:DUF3152 domain-containing protein n=1 Tax=Bifidobacterium sp. ESL0763 TaxID=2983227 RepID=UPI0023F69E80|nr:DUF3152 domain-containing protein [Bifidobacterium sp. ESL0763]MDF7663273.1 DUF3152 domain-containing protein [Bifidobacterium sp. ESL0763]